jgi:hypothetical protein
MTVLQSLFIVAVVVFIAVVGTLAWLGAPKGKPSRKFAWLPTRLSEQTGEAIWYHTSDFAWLEWVECHPMLWGDTLYTRVAKS